MKLSVSVNILFGQFGQRMETSKFLASMEAIKKAGYDGIEFLDWEQVDLDAVKAKKEELGLDVVTIQVQCERMGEEGLREVFLQNLRNSIEAAHKVGSKTVFTSAGHERMFLSREAFWNNMIETLKEARPILDGEGVTLLMEPVNVDVDHAGVFPMNTRESCFLMQILDDPNIKLLFDLYHQQITDGNLLESIRANIDLIGHFHAAAVPGRHELMESELNFPFIVKEIDKLGYDGYLGMEYSPTYDVFEGLVRTKEYLLG
jgi:hydroxypyruvate isomerase